MFNNLVRMNSHLQARSINSTHLRYVNGNGEYGFSLNGNGIVSGFYQSNGGLHMHGFIFDGANIMTIDIPGAISIAILGINSQGQIVGEYLDAQGRDRGFLGAPVKVPEPATWLLLATGLFAFWGRKWKSYALAYRPK